MENEDQYNLTDAIKTYYSVEPLKHNLPKSVADIIFKKQKNPLHLLDRVLYAVLASLIVGATIFCVSLVKGMPVFLALLAVVLFTS